VSELYNFSSSVEIHKAAYDKSPYPEDYPGEQDYWDRATAVLLRFGVFGQKEIIGISHDENSILVTGSREVIKAVIDEWCAFNHGGPSYEEIDDESFDSLVDNEELEFHITRC
jgi:hypothetical protein